MLQDLEYGRLENEYRPVPPVPTDAVLCFRGGDVLLHRSGDNTLTLPTWAELQSWGKSEPRYAFRLQGTGYYLLTSPDSDAPAPYTWEPARKLRQQVSMETCYAVLTGWHLQNWYQNNRLCGSCGAKTVHDAKERMLRCPTCGNLIFPRINPAIIVGVTDGDRILLTKYAGRGYTHYALVAGFTEIGETVEQTVQREVEEEVGLKVKNIRFYKSQPWGIDGGLLLGFFCDLDGSDAVTLDENELSVAQWHERNSLPIDDDGYSLTREMIRVFGEGREPG